MTAKKRRKSKTKVPCRSSQVAAMPPGKPIAPSVSIASDTRSKTSSAASKIWRRIAARYDKLARNFLAATLMVGTLYWIKL